jgi:hypothetical protein
MKQAVFFIWILLLLTLVGVAQTDRSGSIQRQSGITLNSAEIAGREELMKNAPYLATAIIESTQILADGNRIIHNTQELVARDGEGRTRHEEVFDRIGSLEVDAPKTIFISDPVLKKEYTLNTRDRTVTVQPRIDIETLLNTRRAQPERQSPSKEESNNSSGEKEQQKVRRPRELRNEDLGEKVLEGLNAKGERLTATFSVGSVGNERPLEASLETWYSPDLHVFLYRKRIDPRFGEVLYRLTNIKRTDPDPSLFRIPRGYRYTTK